MKNLIVFLTCLFNLTPIMAQDSIKFNKKTPKWCISFTIDNNYNYRYAKNPIFEYMGYPHKYDKTQAALDYLDTCNIACKMKSISVKLEGKIWKFIGFQSGFIIGRKGYMGCRNQAFNSIGIARLYYTNMPLHTLTLPMGININKSLLKKRINISTKFGTEINFTMTNYENYQNKENLPIENKGFFGFKCSKYIDNNIPYDPNEQGILGFAQYYLGINLKLMLSKNTFFNIEYNYISDFKFYTVREYLYLKTYEYERKSYIHRYGAGIGFMF